MSEIKSHPVIQSASIATDGKAPSSAVTVEVVAVSNFAPAIKVFAEKSTSAITLGSQVNATIALSMLVEALTAGGGFYGYPVEVTPKLSVVCGDCASVAFWSKEFSNAINSEALNLVAPLTAGPTNFFDVEGRALLSAGIKPNCDVLILILPAVIRKGSLLREELVPLLHAAHMRCSTVIVVFQGLPTDETAFLTNYFDLVLNIEACEADHGYTSAFTVAPAPGTFLAAIGKRPVIDNIRIGAGGQIERRRYECVSPSAMTREVVKLVEQGRSYTEIAEQYGVNKTTIMRRMDALPFVQKGQLKRRSN